MTLHEYEVTASRQVFAGRVTRICSDQVSMPGGVTSQRDAVELRGAVGIVAVDEHERVLLVRQYRHPVRRRLWEIPTGLLDSVLETALQAAECELAEEGRLRAAEWHILVDTLTSPGMSDETERILLARHPSDLPASECHLGVHEAAEMEREWVPLEAAVARCRPDAQCGCAVGCTKGTSIRLVRKTGTCPFRE
jgi:8-oxo-dGTP pyrophosphatase MutT (NUDIX family)